jgi:hypothetical protein
MIDVTSSHDWDDRIDADHTVLYEALVSQDGTATAGDGYVSVMGPVVVKPPLSDVWHYWRSETLTVPDGTEILLGDLLVDENADSDTAPTDARKAPDALVRQARSELKDLLEKCGGDMPPESWTSLETYGTFAVSKDALVIGFSTGTIMPMACGAPEIRISWSALRGDLSDMGRGLLPRA